MVFVYYKFYLFLRYVICHIINFVRKLDGNVIEGVIFKVT